MPEIDLAAYERIAPRLILEDEMKEPAKREDLPKSEQGQPKRPEVEPEVQERRERGASGEPAPEDFNKGEYHGLTPQQIKKIEDARGDKEPSPDPETPPPPDQPPAEEEARHDQKRK